MSDIIATAHNCHSIEARIIISIYDYLKLHRSAKDFHAGMHLQSIPQEVGKEIIQTVFR